VNETTVHKHLHTGGIFTDVAGYAGVTAATDYVAFSIIDLVVILSVNPNDITEWNLIVHLDAEHYDETDFCPTTVRAKSHVHNQKKMAWFVVLSNCQSGKDYSQEVFTWAITSDTAWAPRLPLSTLDNPKKICAFIPEILVQANDRIYGVSLFDDYNYWSIPLKELGADIDNMHLHCDEKLNTAIIVGHAEGSTEKTLIHLRGNSGMRQDRRYPHIATGIPADFIETGSFNGGSLSFAVNNGVIGFWQSFLDPVVIMSSKTVTGNTDVNVTVTITNGTISQDAIAKVTVVHQAEGEKIKTLNVE
jgi:hypothetical protein